MANCACGTGKTYDNCCGPYITGAKHAPTAEALMRSRYTAYTKVAIDYVEKTHDPKKPDDFNKDLAKQWAENTDWLGLEILATKDGGPEDEEGVVEFVARFKPHGAEKEEAHHEVSLFRRATDEGRWYYVDGKTVKAPFIRKDPKVGRNDPCPCGSGKKAKKCCGAA